MNEIEELIEDGEDDLDIDVYAIHRLAGIAVLSCNCAVPVTHWFDHNGNDCAATEGDICVCGDEEHGWFIVDVSNFSYVTVH